MSGIHGNATEQTDFRKHVTLNFMLIMINMLFENETQACINSSFDHIFKVKHGKSSCGRGAGLRNQLEEEKQVRPAGGANAADIYIYI